MIGHSELIIKTDFLQQMPTHNEHYGHDWALISNMAISGKHKKAINPEPTYYELKSQLQSWMGTTHEDVVKSSTKNTQGNTSNSEEHTKAVTSSTVASSFDDLF